MSIIIKTEEEIKAIKEGGRILGEIMDEVIKKVVPGVSTDELDALAEKLMLEAGGEPAFKGYQPGFSDTAFPCTLCTSINEEVVHAPAIPGRILQEGDIVGIDVGFKYREMFTDMARTIPVGDIDKDARKLLLVTQECLDRAVQVIRVNSSVFEIGAVVEDIALKNGMSVIRDLVGHGVGKEIHEDPIIPNYRSEASKSIKFQPGMVIAVEPMLSLGTHELRLGDDNWAYLTVDKSLSAQFEHTVAINYNGEVEVLTPTQWRMD